MIIPNAHSHPFGCYLCGWAKLCPDDDCLCDFDDKWSEEE